MANPDNFASIPVRHVRVWDGVLKPLGYEKINPLSAATALTVPAGARVALIQTEGQDVRYRDDGTDPTASEGMRLKTTSDGLWYTSNLGALKFIEAVAGATLYVSYYGEGP